MFRKLMTVLAAAAALSTAVPTGVLAMGGGGGGHAGGFGGGHAGGFGGGHAGGFSGAGGHFSGGMAGAGWHAGGHFSGTMGHSWHGGFRDHHQLAFRHRFFRRNFLFFAGPYYDDFGYYNEVYSDEGCLQYERVRTPRGWRWHRVWVCY